jgi:hypothetical protein
VDLACIAERVELDLGAAVLYDAQFNTARLSIAEVASAITQIVCVSTA